MSTSYWTSDFPTQPGYYWFYGWPEHPGSTPTHMPKIQPVQMHAARNGTFGVLDGELLVRSECVGLWAPIDTPPEPRMELGRYLMTGK